MTHDPISDFFARIKNAYMARRDETEAPYSKMILSLAEILKNQGYLGKVEIQEEKHHKKLLMSLLYQDKEPKLTDVVMVSRPGKRVYVKRNELPKVLSGFGMAIISTPEGLMTDKSARKKGIGGELICKLW
ncbi:MAG: 30S ribosomal protein S8, small subunit ribosomal protein S8 [Candidatus Gottesmanbacteria bacterium GW2011_GWA2_43_14]|uniref:Small ribosomal subunit protein uS8 n=1 Tax=Candidatus Gottesmanbacteria bacterium GW2011_GWA2_43_14 TaxID=1618443 RepID=A0A0G1DEH0_9BACT|nr:MAG: 30S ribosomal protein S8, small subunit ribosomal protein S8 [Candidatus Gottesmanbacteria bacterium GW2011_GWA2_43_14]